jgi:antitoxin component YwqK of YwqJK toxin-antitoxin module
MKTKKYILVLLITIICFSPPATAQTGFTDSSEAKNLYKDSLKEGKWVEYLHLRMDTNIIKNVPLYRLVIYSQGKEEGIVRVYSSRGLAIETSYINGKRNGVEKGYNIDGNKSYEIPYTNNRVNGTEVGYYRNGKTNYIVPCANGKLEGIELLYYENGNVKFEIPYIDNEINGNVKSYDEAGNLLSERFEQGGFINKDEAINQLKDSLKVGKWIEYKDSAYKAVPKENAVYYRLAIYTNGKENGTVRRYSTKGGNLEAEATFVEGSRSGPARWFYKSGKLEGENTYSNDTIVGVVKIYYETGELKWENPYLNGKINGIQREYYQTGKLIKETPFADSMQNGIQKMYYDNGELKWEIPYVNGKKNGVEKAYYETVNTPNHFQAWGIARETPYTDDVVNGTQTQYDIRGQVKSQTEYVNGKKKVW